MLWLLAVCLADEAFCLEEELFFVVRQFALELLCGVHEVLNVTDGGGESGYMVGVVVGDASIVAYAGAVGVSNHVLHLAVVFFHDFDDLPGEVVELVHFGGGGCRVGCVVAVFAVKLVHSRGLLVGELESVRLAGADVAYFFAGGVGDPCAGSRYAANGVRLIFVHDGGPTRKARGMLYGR